LKILHIFDFVMKLHGIGDVQNATRITSSPNLYLQFTTIMVTVRGLMATAPSFLLAKRIRFSLLFVVIVLIILSTSHYEAAPSSSLFSKSKKVARELTVAELMARPLTTQLHTVPKLFHQSWSSHSLPAKFERWSSTCREAHPDWEWVLWTDEDNANLVRKYFPSFLKSYQAMQGEIYRADAMRNIYMYIFGG
jgi:mannosyltransferase OCH1-like enzyme